MDILQTFVFNNTRHKVVILRDENDDPLFKASDIGKILSIKNIHTSMIDLHDDKVIRTASTPGGEQKTVFVTEKGVYRLVMRSRKPVAKPFQDWVFEVLKTIRKRGKYALEEEIAGLKLQRAEELADADANAKSVARKHAEELADADADAKSLARKYIDAEDERMHKTLVQGFDNKTCIYFGKIQTMEDNRVLVKIGSTKNIRARTTGLVNEFGSMAIFRVFECDRYEQFEKALHGHNDIKRYRFKEPINGKKSMEVFRMTKEELQRAVNIAVRNVCRFRFDQKGFRETLFEQPEVRVLLKANGIAINDDIDNMDVQRENKRGRCTLTGDKIQAYSPDGKELVCTYETFRDAVRDLPGASEVGIKRACNDRIVRSGYRWARLPRSQPDETVQDIGNTVIDIPIRTGHVAGLNDDKTRVEKIYPSFKACAVANNFASSGAVQKRCSKGVKVGGHHIVSWSELAETIQDAWLENNTLPILPRNATSIRINRLDPVTKEVLRTYGTMNEVARHFKIGRVALRTAINGDLVKFGFKWAYAD
ncbi:unnamed protein product [Ectocarpus sp. 12 AP-2014]